MVHTMFPCLQAESFGRRFFHIPWGKTKTCAFDDTKRLGKKAQAPTHRIVRTLRNLCPKKDHRGLCSTHAFIFHALKPRHRREISLKKRPISYDPPIKPTEFSGTWQPRGGTRDTRSVCSAGQSIITSPITEYATGSAIATSSSLHESFSTPRFRSFVPRATRKVLRHSTSIPGRSWPCVHRVPFSSDGRTALAEWIFSLLRHA